MRPPSQIYLEVVAQGASATTNKSEYSPTEWKRLEHAAPFKAWLVEIARKVAEAGLEDTFLGFGGVRMSEKEKATLVELSEALGLAPPE